MTKRRNAKKLEEELCVVKAELMVLKETNNTNTALHANDQKKLFELHCSYDDILAKYIALQTSYEIEVANSKALLASQIRETAEASNSLMGAALRESKLHERISRDLFEKAKAVEEGL